MKTSTYLLAFLLVVFSAPQASRADCFDQVHVDRIRQAISSGNTTRARSLVNQGGMCTDGMDEREKRALVEKLKAEIKAAEEEIKRNPF